jgi:hypothetical protein
VPGIPVKAAKDPRAPTPPRLPPDGDSIPGLSAVEAKILIAMVRTVCPHDWLEDRSYHDAAFGIVRSLDVAPHAHKILREGVHMLIDQGFLSLTETQRIALLVEQSETSFFRIIHGGAVRYLYDLPEVWAGCGYDGASGCSDEVPRDDFDSTRLGR